MINWRFILNPDDAYPLTMEEPAGWTDTELVLLRDQVYHGISTVFSNKKLELYGEAAAYVKEQYELYGTDAVVILRILLECDDETEDYYEDFTLDFNTYTEHCGSDCRVSIGFGEQGCFLTLRNNFDKKVDLNNNLAFDGTTALTPYTGLGVEITLPAVPLRQQDRAIGGVAHEKILTDDPEWLCDGCTDDSWFGWIMPALPETKFAALGSFVTSFDWEHIRYYGANNIPPYQAITTVNTDTLSGVANCEIENGEANFRLKGTVNINATDWDGGFILRVKLFRLPAGLDETVAGNWQELFSEDAVNEFQSSGSGGSFPYDVDGSIPVTINQGDKFTFGFFYSIARDSEVNSIELLQDASEDDNAPTNFFDLSADVTCPDTEADVYLIYETLSRIAEAITDKCLKIESDYYGRTDSEPDSYDEDGCGSLRCLTSGLYIRKAANPTFFQSMKDTIDGLRCIDNIGFGFMRNSNGDEVMKIEPVSYFYENTEVLRLPNISSVALNVAVNEIYGLIKIGYDKWQPEAINGLDEFNSQREYRVDLKNARQQLDIICKFIAASYLIEQERQQSFAATGAADTAYDDSTFIICLMRDAYGYISDLIVERGIITSPDNIMFPDEVYNYRISPVRNLLRWFKSIAGIYRDHTAHEIIFSAGTGNILAEGFIDDDCALEAAVLSEQDNIEVVTFKNAVDATPLVRPESITFEYPLSLADFKALRANPYGYISYQCGNDDWFKGHIVSVKYKPTNGIATFDLRKKYE